MPPGKVGGEIIVNTTTSGTQDQPSLASLPDGRIAVSWRDASATGGDISGTAIRTQIVDPRDGVVSGTPASSRTRDAEMPSPWPERRFPPNAFDPLPACSP